MKFGLEEKIVSKINSIFLKYSEIDSVILYGSRAKGNYKNGSDIDLTIKGSKLTLRLLNKISMNLDDLFIPNTIDLSIHNQIENDSLIEHISRVGVIFYKKEQ